MGTRGTLVIRYKKRCLYLYNRWDSYPDGLGVALVKEILDLVASPEKWEAFLASLDKLVIVMKEEDVCAGVEAVEASKKYFTCVFSMGDSCDAYSASYYLDDYLRKDQKGLAVGEKIKLVEAMSVASVLSKDMTYEDFSNAIDYGGCISWSVDCPVGPLERYTRLGAICPMDVTFDVETEDRRDLFQEYSYLVDCDSQRFTTIGYATLPFSCLTSPDYYTKFIEEMGDSSD